MVFSSQHRDKITIWVTTLFIILCMYRWWNGMWLYQVRPAFFLTRMDVLTWAFMYTGVHKWLLNNPAAWIIFDVLFCTLPIAYLFAFTRKCRCSTVIAWTWVLFNWIYIQCYTLYPTNSVEVYLAWLLMPLLFTCRTLMGFYLCTRFLRYVLLWFMASAAIWKIIQGGLFNTQEMSAVLYMQHKEFLATSPGYWLSDLYYWLIQHVSFSYLLYLAGAFAELLFIIGFFTTRFDRFLVILFLLFFALDMLIMRISYWEMVPFIVLLFYSGANIPPKKPAINKGW